MEQNIQDIVEKIEKLTVIELAQLVKTLEEKFQISASQIFTAPVQTQTPQAQTPAQSGGTVSVILQSAGDQKVQVIKVLRELNPSLSLKDAKDIVDNTPKPIKEGINIQDAEEIKKKLEALGAKVEIK